MINATTNLTGIGKAVGAGMAPGGPAGAEGAGSTSFADVLKKSIDEVSRLQQDASQAVEDLQTGRAENVSGVMTAMEKADLAFKTLLTIRSKLMEAYDEIKTMQV